MPTLEIGQRATLTRAFSEADVRFFAELSGDCNPVHLDPVYAAETRFGERIVHGILVSSLLSALLGHHLPGDGAIYLGQELNFKAPVYLDMPVTASVEITAIRTDKPIVTLETRCVDAETDRLLISGEARMYVPWLHA
ncbi:MaoC family dehydratase [Marichromatium gracile]|uniref:Enoyl-CoA hydratase n=1 Tax=Marichromatium gracile TaxID=1048 RepID=A0ABR5VFJ6_MARGR|nr:MaoC family dehydratase [Marichromatium gracile]KXX64111.1 enoyl-CoA hydratase [Marichromatium gracile]MCF1183552.1 MaoC family dehydratase [Marichromatium gracile]